MIPQVLELLAEVGIEAEAGEVAATAAEKGFSSLLDFPIPLPLKKSRCLASASYVPRTGELTVIFHSAESLSYPDTSIGTVIALIRADSAGRYYNAYIRGREG
jgi:hypothetical protein